MVLLKIQKYNTKRWPSFKKKNVDMNKPWGSIFLHILEQKIRTLELYFSKRSLKNFEANMAMTNKNIESKVKIHSSNYRTWTKHTTCWGWNKVRNTLSSSPGFLTTIEPRLAFHSKCFDFSETLNLKFKLLKPTSSKRSSRSKTKKCFVYFYKVVLIVLG